MRLAQLPDALPEGRRAGEDDVAGPGRGNPATGGGSRRSCCTSTARTGAATRYAWRDDQTDADLVPADGAEKLVRACKDPVFRDGKREQMWTFHSRGAVPAVPQRLGRVRAGVQPRAVEPHDPTEAGETNQLARLGELGLLNRVGRKRQAAAAVDRRGGGEAAEARRPARATAALTDRARAYLHVNCGHCHRFGGGGAVDFELHATADLDKKVIDAPPTRGTFDLPDARVDRRRRPEPQRAVLPHGASSAAAGCRTSGPSSRTQRGRP